MWKKPEEATAAEPATEAEETPPLLLDEEVDVHTESVSETIYNAGAPVDIGRPGLQSFTRPWITLRAQGIVVMSCIFGGNIRHFCFDLYLSERVTAVGFERLIWMKVNLEMRGMGSLSGWSGSRCMDGFLESIQSARN